MNDSLIPCHDCSKDVSRYAKACPHCGGPMVHGRPSIGVQVAFVNILIVISVLLFPLIIIYGKEAQLFGSYKVIIAGLPAVLSGAVHVIGLQLYQFGRKSLGLRYILIGGGLFLFSLAVLFFVNFL